MLPSVSSGLFDDSHFAPTHSLQPWQIALIAVGAVLILVFLPWFILRRLRRPRPRPRNVDLLGHPTSSMQSQWNRRGGGSAEQQQQDSRENDPARWRPVQTLVDFLSFGSGQDNNDYYWRRSYISGATSLSDPPPAYNLHTTTTNINDHNDRNRRASAAPTYRSREESRRHHRQTRSPAPALAPATNLPMLRLVLPEGDDGWASEFDRELKSPYSLGRFDPDTPTGEYFDSPSAGGRFEKR